MTTGRSERLGRPLEPVSASRDGAGDDPLVIRFDQLSPDSDALDRSGASRGWKLGLGLGVVVALGVGFVAGRVQRQEPDVDRRGPVSVRLPGADTGLDSAVLVATTPTDTNLDARIWLIGPSVEMGVLDGEASPYQQADQAMLIADTIVSLTEGQVGLRSVASDRAEVLSMSATSLVAVPTGPDTQLVGVVDDESLWMLDPTDPSTLTQRELPEGVVAIVGALDASTFVVETDTVDAVPRWARWGLAKRWSRSTQESATTTMSWLSPEEPSQSSENECCTFSRSERIKESRLISMPTICSMHHGVASVRSDASCSSRVSTDASL